MDQKLNVYAMPSLVTPEELVDATVVVIDVLRASTTIVHAIDAGAVEVIPCLEVEEARQKAQQYELGDVVLGGERGGLPIEGFDLGNSPSHYTPYRVAGKTLLFTTSNGTRAIMQCHLARRVLIGALVNATAVAEHLVSEDRVAILCAGTEGSIGRDDVLCAGLLVDWLQRRGGLMVELNAQALTARENWTSTFAVPYTTGAEPFPTDLLARELLKSPGGQKLAALGLAEDIEAAAQLDRFPIVPELDPATFRITLPDRGRQG